MTLKYLIINYLRCHLSFVTFAFTLSFQNFIGWLIMIIAKFNVYLQQNSVNL